MKKLLILFLVVTSLCSTGCVSLFKNSNSDSRDKIDDKVAEIQNKKEELAVNNGKKLSQIGVLAVGTHYALDKENDPSKEIEVARELNDRIMSLSEVQISRMLKEFKKL